MTVFYEALCPDSKYFITKQLQPAFYKAPALIDFQLIPYGKATTTTNSDGSLAFLCQHGEIECNANIYHACCIEAINEPKVLIDVIACMIRNNLLPKEAMQKVGPCSIDWELKPWMNHSMNFFFSAQGSTKWNGSQYKSVMIGMQIVLNRFMTQFEH